MSRHRRLAYKRTFSRTANSVDADCEVDENPYDPADAAWEKWRLRRTTKHFTASEFGGAVPQMLGVNVPPRFSGEPRCASYPELEFSQIRKKSVIRLCQQVCRECPALSDCFEQAKASGNAKGVWGGLAFNNGELLDWSV